MELFVCCVCVLKMNNYKGKGIMDASDVYILISIHRRNKIDCRECPEQVLCNQVTHVGSMATDVTRYYKQ
jgi:hypothetical protein